MCKRVAILGCGPAGLLAAHAAVQNDCEIRIFAKKRQSPLYGAQYLHAPIPGVTGLPERLTYETVGTPEDYRLKVYGDSWDGTVSPEDLDPHHSAWDIRMAYHKLWYLYDDDIEDVTITSEIQARDLSEGADVIISTIPRTIWKRPGDVFESTKIWAIGDAPDRGQFVPFRPTNDNTVICDGSKDVGWYRASRVFGHSTIEWPGGVRPPVEGVEEVTKPLGCRTTGASDFIHLGRYGKWEKGVLTTDAYDEALKATA